MKIARLFVLLLFFSCSGVVISQVKTDTSKLEIVDLPALDASFPGGVEALRTYCRERITYLDRQVSYAGKVYVSFFVEVDGSISEVKVVRGIDEFNEMVVAIIQGMPKWIPAENPGGPVRSRVAISVDISG